ncbi:MAG: hypothetical protein PHX07_00225 [Candidatus Marinimicrobia bacterium]|nr:hypothetical protein [Candidatus Neomarinimicrobiota bacterium]
MKRITAHLLRIMTGICMLAGGLHAQMLILNPAENAVSELHRIAVTVMGKPSAEATLYINNNPVSSGELRVDGIYDFLNIPVPEGPVTIRVEAPGAGERIFVAERNIHVLGPPSKILPYEDALKIEADGKSEGTLRFEIRDEWGYRLGNLKTAGIQITHGQILDKDMDSLSAGIQVPVRNGVLEFTVRAPKEAARATLEISAGGNYFQFPLRFITPREPLMLVGSLSGGASNYQPFADAANEPDAEEWSRNSGSIAGLPFLYGGRAALYAKGNLFGKYRFTASYDSRRNYQDQFFRDIDPSQQYALYGDASKLEYDAQTQSQLFVKLERDESSIMYGDFNTGSGKREFTAYNRTFNGINGTLKLGSHSLNAFATLTDREMQMDEIRGEGISGYYYLSRSNITEYSDKIVIQTRDRYHPEILLRSVDQTRFQDYSINYEDGSIMFKQPVPGIDASGNPVTIVVAYENKTGKRENAIAGLNYSGTFFGKLNLGAMAVAEERYESYYLLYGANAEIPLFSWLSLKGEYAESLLPENGGSNSRGKAYKAEFLFAPWDVLNVKAYYRTVDSLFVNESQSGRSNETGSEKYGINAVLGNEKTGRLTTEYYRQFNKMGTVNENSAEVFTLGYSRKFTSRGEFKVAYEDASRIRQNGSSGSSELNSQMIRGSFTYKLSDKLSALAERDQNLKSNDQSKPTHSSIGLSYALSEKLSIFAKYRRLEGDRAGNQFIVGLDSKVAENTQLSGKYEIGGAMGESRNRATVGLKNKWVVTKALTLNFAYENVSSSDGFETPTVEHQSLSLAFEFLPEIPWKSSGKWEFRSSSDSRQFNYLFATDFRIARGLSLIAKSVNSTVRYRAAANDYVIKSDNQLGIAYRPERSDYYNAVAKLAYIVDENTHVTPQVSSARFIVSMHHYWQPFEKLEIGMRLAKRVVVDEEIGLFEDRTVTDFIAMRLEYDLNLKWYAAMDLRYIYLQPLDETKFGASVEAGYLLAKNLQLGLGYALLNYEDPDFSDQNYLYKNIFLTLHMKFSENIFNWK